MTRDHYHGYNWFRLITLCMMTRAAYPFTTQRRSLLSAGSSNRLQKSMERCDHSGRRSWRRQSISFMEMRDASASYWFKVGDTVKVVKDVMKAGSSLRNRRGTVVETWEKCDVDPTCCCAEQVDLGMAVRVEFQDEISDGGSDNLEIGTCTSFFHYFGEEELVKIEEE